MIRTDQLEKILVEVVTGKPPSLQTPEADAIRAQFTREVEEIRAKGGVVEIPGEIPDVPEGE
jgi:hypothetical protein